MYTSDTFSEETLPVKLPIIHFSNKLLAFFKNEKWFLIDAVNSHLVCIALINKQCKNYSKGARGLFVLLQKLRIFTKSSNSSRSEWRQWRSRYAIQQVGTYPTNDFATLGPSELQPPFAWAYNQSQNPSISL